MRKLLILSTLALFAVSAAGCNHCRQTCGRGCGGFGGGLFGNRQSNYGYDDGCCCESGGEIYGDGGGMMINQGAPCCN